MRISQCAVILFCGAEKTARYAQDCDKVRPHFLLANKLSKAIDQAIVDKDILIDEETETLKIEESFFLEI